MRTNDNGPYRVAVASSDGKVINLHFGRADSFIIVDINRDGSYTYVGRRTVKPLCNGGEHTESGVLSSLEALSDCTAVIAAKIGSPIQRALALNNISAFEQADYIENALEKLTKYYTGAFEKNNCLGMGS